MKYKCKFVTSMEDFCCVGFGNGRKKWMRKNWGLFKEEICLIKDTFLIFFPCPLVASTPTATSAVQYGHLCDCMYSSTTVVHYRCLYDIYSYSNVSGLLWMFMWYLYLYLWSKTNAQDMCIYKIVQVSEYPFRHQALQYIPCYLTLAQHWTSNRWLTRYVNFDWA